MENGHPTTMNAYGKAMVPTQRRRSHKTPPPKRPSHTVGHVPRCRRAVGPFHYCILFWPGFLIWKLQLPFTAARPDECLYHSTRESPLNAMLSPKAASLDRTNCFQLGLSCAGINSRRLAGGATKAHSVRAAGNLRYSPFSFRLGRKDSMKRSILAFIVGLVDGCWSRPSKPRPATRPRRLRRGRAQMVFTHGMMAARSRSVALHRWPRALPQGWHRRALAYWGARRSPARGIRPGTLQLGRDFQCGITLCF